MRCLIFDCQNFKYELDHPTPVAEPTDIKHANFDQALVVFVCVEDHDLEETISPAAKEIRKIARKSNSVQIVINPFAHLSLKLANPEQARLLSRKLVERLKESWEGQVEYTSFGWYKKFMVDVLGHDHAQIWREF